MAYFSNGTDGQFYREKYCDKCRWDKDNRCPIWSAHLLHNYKECNNEDSVLHMLIRRKKAPDYGNEECFFFMPETLPLPLEDAPRGACSGPNSKSANNAKT